MVAALVAGLGTDIINLLEDTEAEIGALGVRIERKGMGLEAGKEVAGNQVSLCADFF